MLLCTYIDIDNNDNPTQQSIQTRAFYKMCFNTRVGSMRVYIFWDGVINLITNTF